MPLIATRGAASAQGFGEFAQQARVVQADAIDFSNDYLSRSDLTGNTNGKTFTFSAWIWFDGTNTDYVYYANGNASSYFYVGIVSNGTLVVEGTSTTGSVVLSGSYNFSTLNNFRQTFYHVLISVDLTDTAKRSIYVNDVAVSVSWVNYTNTNIAFIQPVHTVAGVSAAADYRGRLSNVFLDYTYRDMSITANRRLFVTADLKPATGQAALNPIMYLPMSDPTAPGLNQGTGGNFTLTGVVARSGRGPNQYNAPYSDFDGANDYLSSTGIFGIADSSTFTVHCVFTADSVSTAQKIVFFGSDASNRFQVAIDPSGQISLQGYNSSGTQLLGVTTVASIVVGRNYVLDVSVELFNPSARHFFINGQAVSVTWNVYTGGFIDFSIGTTPRYHIGANTSTSPSQFFNGRLGALWFNTSYIDLSVAANLAKFVSGTGIDAAPVDTGRNGQLPTGTSPLICMPMYGNTPGFNFGTGNDFTVNSGPYTGARGPNEYWASAVGNSGFMFRNTPLDGVVNTKTLTFFAMFRPVSTGVTRSFWYAAGAANSSFVAQIQVNAGNALNIVFRNASDVAVLTATLTNRLIDSTSQTYAIHFSVDLSDTSKRSVYVNGLVASVTWSTYTNDTMNFAAQRSAFGAEWGSTWSGSLLRGVLGGFYLSNSYIDFTQESNRLLFADAFNQPTNLPAAIAAGTVQNPLIYMLFDPANNGANSGTGGNYTNSSMSDGGQL